MQLGHLASGARSAQGLTTLDTPAAHHESSNGCIWTSGGFGALLTSRRTSTRREALGECPRTSRTWSAPIRVNQTPAVSNLGNRQAHTPSVHVADDGTVGVSYYDFRKNTPGNGTGTDHWLVHCDGACNRVGSWGGEEVRIGTTFDIQLAPFANGYFLGDNVGLDNIGDDFTPFFTWTMPDPADVY